MKNDALEDLIVVKRSGQRVNFNSYKIAVAIKSAFDSVYEYSNEPEINVVYENVIKYIEENYSERKTINVEDIQDIIENALESNNNIEVYESFSEYRKKRAESRKFHKIKQEHKFARAMEKISDNNLLTGENNLDCNDILLKYGSIVCSELAKSYIIDTKSLRAHEEGNIYIHNLDTFALGQLQDLHWNVDLIEDFDYFENDLFGASWEVSGYINIPNFDYIMGKYIMDVYKKNLYINITKFLKLFGIIETVNLTKLKDSINKQEDFNYNLDFISQFMTSPLTEYIYNLGSKTALEETDEYVFKKLDNLLTKLNKTQKYSISFGLYKTDETKLINNYIFKTINNDLYPNIKYIYKFNNIQNEYIDSIKEIINSGKELYLLFSKDPNLEYFTNGIKVYENNYNEQSSSKGRFSVAETSINVARLALESANQEEFYQKLNSILEITKNELLLTFETIGNKTKDNYKILFSGNVATDEKLQTGGKIRKVIKNSTLIIGVVGLNEAVLTLKSDDKIQLLKDILKFLTKKCNEYSKETKLNFVFSDASSSKASKEFMTLDKSIYGIEKNLRKANAYQSIFAELNQFNKDDIQKLFNGGCMLEIEKTKNILETMEKSHIEFVHITGEKNEN